MQTHSRDWKQQAELLEQMQAEVEADLHARKYLRTHLREGRERRPRKSSRSLR